MGDDTAAMPLLDEALPGMHATGGEGERRTLREDAASSPQVHPGAVTAQRTGDERKSVRDLLLLVDALAPGRERARWGGGAKKCPFLFASAVRGLKNYSRSAPRRKPYSTHREK